jgi:hypothetical protein
MAPFSRPTSPSFVHSWPTSIFTTRFPTFVLFVFGLAAAARLYYVISSRRKRRMSSPTASLEQESKSRKSSPDRANSYLSDDPNIPLDAIKEELSQLSPKPVYPWIAPPTPLPGPYDAPYYPLPTIRRLSQDSANELSEEIRSISYTRRISASNVPEQESTINATTTISNHGWRRTQWTVSSG